MLSLPLVSPFPLGPSLGQGSLLRPGGRLSRLLRPGGCLSRLLRPGGRLSRLLRLGGRLSRLLRPSGRLSRLLRPGGRLSRLLCPGGRLSRLRDWKPLLGGGLCHECGCHSLNCTSPMDYISHHALHSHIPIHHYTSHTAVTIHSLVLIVSPHLHLIHSHTFKQHSHMHSLRSEFCPG